MVGKRKTLYRILCLLIYLQKNLYLKNNKYMYFINVYQENCQSHIDMLHLLKQGENLSSIPVLMGNSLELKLLGVKIHERI